MVQDARPGVTLHEIGSRGVTFQDFMDAIPRAPRDLRRMYPLGPCPGDVWSPGGRLCNRSAFAQSSSEPMRAPRSDEDPSASCTPLVTWLQHPVKRFLSSFYEHSGLHTGPLKGNSSLSARYELGMITPDEVTPRGST